MNTSVKPSPLQRVQLGESHNNLDRPPVSRGAFGYDITHPIVVHQPEGAYDYLISLECPCARPFWFHRLGTLHYGPDTHPIEQFELLCRRNRCHLILYLDMQHARSTMLLPKGLRHGPPKGQGVFTSVERFPELLPLAIAAFVHTQRMQRIRGL